LVLGDKLFAQDVTTAGGNTAALRRRAPEYSAVMEWGTVEGVDHTWKTIPMAKHYKNAVVVVKRVSSNGSDPGMISTRNVTSDSFEVRYSEWSYLDDRHVPERLFYLVVEEGSHFLAGLEVMATNVSSNKLLEQGQWEDFVFDAPYDEAPAVFSSVSSTNGDDPITSRLNNVSVSGFSATMQEEEAKTDGHVTETLSLIVIEKGSGTTSDNRMIKVLNAATDHTARKVDFGHTSSLRYPVVVGDISSTFEPDPCVLQYKNLTSSSVELSLQEEKSYDSETTHALEDISIFVAE
jgi:hypothetical protein